MKNKFFALLCWLALSPSISANDLPAVIVDSIKQTKARPDIEIAGRISAVQRVDIIPRVSGILEQRHFVEGTRVEQGAALFSIEKVAYDIQLKQAKAALLSAQAAQKQANAELSRQRTLRKTGATSKAQLESAEASFDQAKAQVLQAQAQLQQAELNLSYTDITSPISGKISRALINSGNLVAANTSQLATVVQTDPVYVDFIGIGQNPITSQAPVSQFARSRHGAVSDSGRWPALFLRRGIRLSRTGSQYRNRLGGHTCTISQPRRLAAAGGVCARHLRAQGCAQRHNRLASSGTA